MRPSEQISFGSRDDWLAELAEAIDDAAQLAWRLGYIEGDSADARSLFDRLGSLRAELTTFRRRGLESTPAQTGPFWNRLLRS
jgi:hypothetical protein